MIIFNNFDINQSKDSSDDEQQSFVSQQEWFDKIKNAIREFSAQQIMDNIFENFFDFSDIYFRNSKTKKNKDIEQSQIEEIIKEFIL